MRLRTHLFICSALALLAACSASVPQRQDEFRAVDQYLKYDQGSVGSINYFGRFDGWKPVGRDQLLVWDGLSNAYLISVAPPCHDLEFTNAIGFSTRVRGSITSGVDEVRMTGERCRIIDIRRIDYKKMKADQKKEKE